jgi:phosphonate transport system substrate-binding protein
VAAGGGDILIDLPVVKNAIDTSELTVLAKTEPLLFLPWAVRRTMPTKLREAVQTALTDLDDTEEGQRVLNAAKTSGIKSAEDGDYAVHRRMIYAVLGPQGLPNSPHAKHGNNSR